MYEKFEIFPVPEGKIVALAFRRAMDHLKKLRHDLRGGLNAIKLCATVLELSDPDECRNFLDAIIAASDTMDEQLQRLAALPDSCWADAAEPVSFSLSPAAQGQPS